MDLHYYFSRKVLGAIALSAATLLAPVLGHAADPYPTRPVRLVVTFPTGGAPDILARIFAEKAQLGQPVIVDNVPGAGGNIGADRVAKAAPDGHMLVLATVGTHSINGSLYAKMPYDMAKDFAPVAMIASTPNMVVATNSLPVKNIQELIAWGRANPNKLTYGTPGVGTSTHIAGELFSSMTGVPLAHIPYKGRQFAVPDLVGGNILLMFDNMPSALPMVREGKIRALGQTGARRSPAAPDIPTLAEQGLAGYEATSWFAMFAPARTPPEVIARLNAEVLRIYRLPEIQERLKTLGLDAILSSPEELGRIQAAEIAKWGKVIRESGARVD